MKGEKIYKINVDEGGWGLISGKWKKKKKKVDKDSKRDRWQEKIETTQ